MNETRLEDASLRFLAWARVNLSPRSVAVYRLYLARFAAWAGNVPLASLSPAMVTTWNRKFHPLQAVQRLCSWCHREERSIAVNPLAGMRKATCGKRHRILDRREAVGLLRATDRAFRAFLLSLRETFARPQEMRAVRPCDIRQAGGAAADLRAIAAGDAFFLLENGKGFSRRADQSAVRIIPISPRLGRLLLRLLAGAPEALEPIFRNSLGRPWTANAVRCRMRRLRSRAGNSRNDFGENVVAYTWRHTGATAAARAGLRDFMLAELLGHSSPRTTARYVHLQAADVVAAVKRLWERNRERGAKNEPLRSPKNAADEAR